MTNKRRPTTTDSDESLPTSAIAPDTPSRPGRTTLADIRADATARMADAAHTVARTIADLEAWRAEIDATIAFLKAQRR